MLNGPLFHTEKVKSVGNGHSLQPSRTSKSTFLTMMNDVYLFVLKYSKQQEQ